MIRLLLLPLAFSSCVTTSAERTRLLSKEVIAEPCVDDELTGSVDSTAAKRVHLSLSVHQHCPRLEREIWAAQNSSKLDDLPRLLIALSATVVLLGAATALVFAISQDQEASVAIDTVGYASALGIGAVFWVLLGASSVSDAPNQLLETELPAERLTHAYVGPVQLASGTILNLDARGADVDLSELTGAVVRIGDSVIPIDGLAATRTGPPRPDARLLP